MGSTDAVEALLMGDSHWNFYRSYLAPGERPDLSGADLQQANLAGRNLEGADLTAALLNQADLTRVNLRFAVLTDADLSGADLSHADLTGALLDGADLSGTKLTLTTLRGTLLDELSTPKSVTNSLRPFTKPSPWGLAEGVDPDAVRIRMNLPAGVDPQLLAACVVSVSVATQLAAKVGAGLQRRWFDDSPQRDAGSVLISTAADSTTFAVRRANYGSPFEIDLFEIIPSIMAAGGVAVTTVGGVVAHKRGFNLISFLLTLARKEERDHWLDERAARLETAVERQRADLATERHRRAKAEKAISKLHIHPASEAEARHRVTESTLGAPEIQALIIEVLPQLMPILATGATVITSAENSPNSTSPEQLGNE